MGMGVYFQKMLSRKGVQVFEKVRPEGRIMNIPGLIPV
jgi:hypothetical protein